MVKVISCPQCGQRLCKAEAGTNIVEVMCPKCKAIFAGKDEMLTLTHTATSREVFATGALKAAEYLAKKKAGRYDMSDMINGR